MKDLLTLISFTQASGGESVEEVTWPLPCGLQIEADGEMSERCIVGDDVIRFNGLPL